MFPFGSFAHVRLTNACFEVRTPIATTLVLASVANATMSRLEGSGAWLAVAGHPSTLTLHLRDRFGNPTGELLGAVLASLHGPAVVEALVIDADGPLLKASYMATESSQDAG
jgi:hypothetical protein